MRRLDGITDLLDMSFTIWEMVKQREAWGAAVHRAAKSRTYLSTEQNNSVLCIHFCLHLLHLDCNLLQERHPV